MQNIKSQVIYRLFEKLYLQSCKKTEGDVTFAIKKSNLIKFNVYKYYTVLIWVTTFSMLVLTMDCHGERLEPMLVKVTEQNGVTQFECSNADMDENMKQTVQKLKQLHTEANPMMKTNSTLFAALRNLQQFGARYRKHKEVAQAVEAIEALLQSQKDEDKRSVFCEMLGLPSYPFSRLFRRVHRKKTKETPLRFAATNLAQGVTMQSQHPAAVSFVSAENFSEDSWDSFFRGWANGT